MDKKNNIHKYVNRFNPDISVMNTECRDYLFDFHAGSGNENFNDFFKKEADEYRTNGNGVTYIIWNNTYDKETEKTKDIVAYFTLSANAIPYIDRIKLDGDEIAEGGMKYDEQTWGIPVLEIKMFAVNNKYQDMTHNMLPFASINSDMRPMWLPLKNIHMNYDK